MTALLLACLLAADPAPPEPLLAWDEVHRLKHDLVIDGAVTGGLLAAWIGSEVLLKHTLAPHDCRWCASNGLDEWGRGLRGRPNQLLVHDMLSNVVDFAVLPLAIAGVELYLGGLKHAPLDLLLILEATAAAVTLNQFVKMLVGRERPFVHAQTPEEKLANRDPADNNLSFFSGHSTFAFALAVGAGTVASLRGYRRAWLAWLVGLPIAAAVPLLRMAADRHYLTDVLVGSAVGAAMGYGIPVLFHGRQSVQLVPVPGGAGLAAVF